MASTTRESLAASKSALAASTGMDNLAAAEELLAAGRTIGESAQLRSIVSDPGSEPSAKLSALTAVFGRSLSAPVLELLGVAVGKRWSHENDLLAAIEELGLRAAASSAPADADIEGELFAFGAVVSNNPELELAISSKLGDSGAKAALVDRLLSGKVSEHTRVILRHLVRQPRDRKIRTLVAEAAAVVADQLGFAIATVTTAKVIDQAQLGRLQTSLSNSFGRQLKLNQVIDPELVGGVRVQVGDEIIDDSVATRLNDLRLQLAG